MNSTDIANSICQAIGTYADDKISKANFDQSIKAIIVQCLDRTTGSYKVKYQDSIFQANATSSQINYNKGQQVWVLIPGNDWSRTKTIVSGVEASATTYREITPAKDLYNAIGGNLIKEKDEKDEKYSIFELSSYQDETIPLYEYSQDPQELQKNLIIIDQDLAEKNIKQGNGLALGMTVQTKLATGQQIAGTYGLRAFLQFKDSKGGAAVVDYTVNSTDVIGFPYTLIEPTPVECFIKNIDAENFERIQRVQIYCTGFPQNQNKKDIKDIFITNIKINGASALTDNQLSGYILHINSENNTIPEIPKSENGEDKITLQAQLKSNGKLIRNKVDYYWFRQNSLIFRGSDRYFGFAGDGWQCLNQYAGTVPNPAGDTFNFTSDPEQIDETTCLLETKKTKIKCVALYDKKERVSSQQYQVFNLSTGRDIEIQSSDLIENNVNKTDYFLSSDRPTFTCIVVKKEGEEDSDFQYKWFVTPARGVTVQKEQTKDLNDKYNNANNSWNNEIKPYIQSLPEAEQKKYMQKEIPSEEDENKTINPYEVAKQAWQEIEFVQRIQGNKYHHFPVGNISNYSKISCAVEKINNDGTHTYLGTASITIYNHLQTEGFYRLNITNGTQVFQYDKKGNSPISTQLEKPLEILPLSFTLLDKTGTQVTYEQIKQNGVIRWLVPGENTLLIPEEELKTEGEGVRDVKYRSSIGVGADIALSATYNIYKNRKIFHYTIADIYDEKKTNNHIRLNIIYKDLIFDAYTDFTFPKDGDPGTNGTDYVAKLFPANVSDDGEILEVCNTDRVYIDSKGSGYDDNGYDFNSLKFQLYNNSRVVSEDVDFWTCPPVTSFDTGKADKSRFKSYINIDNGKVTKKDSLTLNMDSFSKGNLDNPVNIVRAQNGTENNIKYFAQYPICFSYLNVQNYRFKIKPKTGFKYVVYAEDGTLPDYDNTLPFEVIVQKYTKDDITDEQYYVIQNDNNIEYEWYTIGQIEIDKKLNQQNNIVIEDEQGNTISTKKCYFKPADKFNSSDISNAIVVKIKEKTKETQEDGTLIYKYNYLGWLHVPIYMIINRYGHSAINSWDGTSIEMKEGGDIILAPQVGAGTKNDNNQFTGVLIGDVKSGENNQQGLFGYHEGQRSIFLDANTGKAQFGKQGAGKIILNPNEKINGKDTALIYSGNYPINDFKNTNKGNYNVKTTGELQSNRNKDNKGLMIDLSTPQIGFGSGNFTVNSKGQLVARGGGQIAGWTISDDALYKHDEVNKTKTGMRSNGDPAFYAGFNSQNSTDSTSTNAYNFFVNHNGYLYSKSGQIAKWSIDENTLTDGNVGMGQGKNITANTFDNQTSAITNARIWSGNDTTTTFAVTADGKLYSKDGQIASWSISKDQLKHTSGKMGMGSYNGKYEIKSGINTTYNTTYNAIFWSNNNFAVDEGGNLYSASGKIGGWNIAENKLWAGNETGEGIRLYSDGSMDGGNSAWGITKEGKASFANIDAYGGKVGGWEITSSHLKGGNVTLNNDGSLEGGSNGSNWSIKANGDAYFNYIHGKIASASGGTVYLTNGTSGNGSDGTFSIGSDGSCRFGTAGKDEDNKALTYTPNGVLSLGNWTIAGNSIKNEPGSTELHQNQIIAKEFVAVSSGSSQNPGVSGKLTFSDGSSLTIMGGIITGVEKGDGASWTNF